MTKTYTTKELDAALFGYIDAVEGKGLQSEYILDTDRVDANFDKFGEAIDFFMYYPDVFLDIITPLDSQFNLFPFQRVSLRAKMRKRQVFETATRGASKSWGAFASRYLTCMFVPRHTSFVVTDVKEQAVSIAREKIQDDLWIKFPLLANEMIPYRLAGGKLRTAVHSAATYASYRFSTGATFDVVGITSARGKRRHSGLIEEVIQQDQTKINESILPLMNISRRTLKGNLNPSEPFNAQKIFVTSAGYMNTFAYDKMLETLFYMVLYPEDYMMLTIDYRVPLKAGLLDEKTIREVRSNPSFDRGSFEREYGSKWSGEVKGAAFSMAGVFKTRKIVQAEYKPRKTINDYGEDFYVIGADMAKDGSANTAISVIRVAPGKNSFRYMLVNGYIASSSDYEVVSNEMKRTAIRYDAKLMVVDTNGIGAAIRDWLNKPSVDSKTGEQLPGFGIINPPTNVAKDLIKHPQNNIIYEIKANGQSASAINWFFFSRLRSGSFRMLIPFRTALERFGEQKHFPFLSESKKQRLMKPYQFVDMFERELLNLDIQESNTGSGDATLRLRRRKNDIQKDLFSSVSYAMYGTHQHLEQLYYKRKHNKTQSLRDFVQIGSKGR